MCTVTYIPYKKHGFVLTSSRDERQERLSEADITEKTIENTTFLYPKDPVSKGTWFGCSSKGIVGCLLNGAFDRYERKPPYRKSRGLILLEILESFGSKKMLVPEFLGNIEPFTVVLVKHFSEDRYVQEFRWDGDKIHTLTIDSETPHLWASAALFDPSHIEEKKANFVQLMSKNAQVTPDDLLTMHQDKKISGQPYYPHFSHLQGGMVNITQVTCEKDQFLLKHLDVSNNKAVEKHMPLSK